jgi:hypothetical protein
MKKKQLITRIATLEVELAEMKRQRDVLIENRDQYSVAEVRMLYEFEQTQKRLEEYMDKAFERRGPDKDGVFRTGGIVSHIFDKPPLGLRPKYITDSERIGEIEEAIKRYVAAKKDIPEEWYVELGKLLYQPSR